MNTHKTNNQKQNTSREKESTGFLIQVNYRIHNQHQELLKCKYVHQNNTNKSDGKKSHTNSLKPVWYIGYIKQNVNQFFAVRFIFKTFRYIFR
jgi:hypothetical protein